MAFSGALLNVYLYGHTKRWGPPTGILFSFVFIAYAVMAYIPVAILTNVLFVLVHYKNLRKLNDSD